MDLKNDAKEKLKIWLRERWRRDNHVKTNNTLNRGLPTLPKRNCIISMSKRTILKMEV